MTGALTIPAETYHADQLADQPCLSASIAKILLAKSPWHAWHAHPRLNPQHKVEAEPKFDIGTVAHALLLQGEEIARVLPYDSWRTNESKEARDTARAEGKIPLLADQWADVLEMVDAVRNQLGGFEVSPPLLSDGKAEQTLVWDEGGITCKARLDWLRDDLAAIDDLKTVGQTANPLDWSRRTFWSIGCDLQAAFYMRGVKALFDIEPDMRFIVAETAAPFGVSVVGLAPSALAIGGRKVEWAIAKWRECLTADRWPGYPLQMAAVEVDGWQEADMLQRIGTEEFE